MKTLNDRGLIHQVFIIKGLFGDEETARANADAALGDRIDGLQEKFIPQTFGTIKLVQSPHQTLSSSPISFSCVESEDENQTGAYISRIVLNKKFISTPDENYGEGDFVISGSSIENKIPNSNTIVVQFLPSDSITVSLTPANPIEWCNVTTGKTNKCCTSDINKVTYPHRINGETQKSLDFGGYAEESNKLPKNSTYQTKFAVDNGYHFVNGGSEDVIISGTITGDMKIDPPETEPNMYKLTIKFQINGEPYSVKYKLRTKYTSNSDVDDWIDTIEGEGTEVTINVPYDGYYYYNIPETPYYYGFSDSYSNYSTIGDSERVMTGSLQTLYTEKIKFVSNIDSSFSVPENFQCHIVGKWKDSDDYIVYDETVTGSDITLPEMPSCKLYITWDENPGYWTSGSSVLYNGNTPVNVQVNYKPRFTKTFKFIHDGNPVSMNYSYTVQDQYFDPDNIISRGTGYGSEFTIENIPYGYYVLYTGTASGYEDVSRGTGVYDNKDYIYYV